MSKLLYPFSWIVAAYFGAGVIAQAGFPPKADLLLGDALFIALFLLFLFMPFFNKIKVGSWLELEREVKEAKGEATAAKRELADFKIEMRNTLNVVSTQRTNVYVNGAPNAAQLREQQAAVSTKLTSTEQSTVEKYEETVKSQESDDVAYVLAKVRIDIERLLRTVVGGRTDPVLNAKLKVAGARQLFDSLVQSDEAWKYLQRPFEYVNQVCNAAIHGQLVSMEQADEAIKLGAQIVAALKQHPNANSG